MIFAFASNKTIIITVIITSFSISTSFSTTFSYLTSSSASFATPLSFSPCALPPLSPLHSSPLPPLISNLIFLHLNLHLLLRRFLLLNFFFRLFLHLFQAFSTFFPNPYTLTAAVFETRTRQLPAACDSLQQPDTPLRPRQPDSNCSSEESMKRGY